MRTSLFKAMTLAFSGACIVAGCQKDPSPVSGEAGNCTVKYAEEVRTGDNRVWDEDRWMTSTGVLSFLEELKDQRGSVYVQNVPTGIEVIGETFVYVTFIGEVADFNNVLGYYYYDKKDLPAGEEAAKEFILDRIYKRNQDKSLEFRNVIFNNTKNGISLGTTFCLKTDDNKKFTKGTVIGFYLLPNGGVDENSFVPQIDDSGTPYVITTNPALNMNKDNLEGLVSHIMGKSACSDLVVSFEDLSSIYGGKSDWDYNDLAFVVGDNLDTRYTCNLTYFTNPSKPFDLDDAELFGDPNYCMRCNDDERYKYMLEEVFVESRDLTKYDQYAPLFHTVPQIPEKGKITIKTNAEGVTSTDLYAYFEHVGATYYNTIGWYKIVKGYEEDADYIKKSVTNVNGTIKAANIIYTDVQNTNIPVKELKKIGTFNVGDEIGFFIIPRNKKDQSKDFTTNLAAEVRFTTVKPSSGLEQRQSQIILSGICNSLMVGFEDISKKSDSDRDYNDVIFSITDNKETLRISTIETSNFYTLKELMDDLKARPIK